MKFNTSNKAILIFRQIENRNGLDAGIFLGNFEKGMMNIILGNCLTVLEVLGELEKIYMVRGFKRKYSVKVGGA